MIFDGMKVIINTNILVLGQIILIYIMNMFDEAHINLLWLIVNLSGFLK